MVATGVEVLKDGRLTGSSALAGGGWAIEAEIPGERRTYIARRVLDCSGRRAVFAHHRGARRQITDRLVAILGLLRASECEEDATLVVEATPYGWWYTVVEPLRGRVVGLLSDGDLLRELGARYRGKWWNLLSATRHVGPLALQSASVPVDLIVVAANSTRLTRMCGDGWAAAGDAAATYDPLSSQGIITALHMGHVAADALDDGSAAAQREYSDFVDRVIRKYERDRCRVYGSNRRWSRLPFWQRRDARSLGL
jgi:flavin-dependent dehydrogenase